MKTSSGTLKIVLTAFCGLAAVVCLRAVATPTPTPTPTAEIDPPMPSPADEGLVLRIKGRHLLKDNTDKGEQAFAELICYSGNYPKEKKNVVHLRHHKETTDKKHEHFLPGSCDQFPSPAPTPSQTSTLNIKTDTVTVSETAKTFEDGELTPIGLHVTQQIAVSNQVDLKKVVDSLDSLSPP